MALSGLTTESTFSLVDARGPDPRASRGHLAHRRRADRNRLVRNTGDATHRRPTRPGPRHAPRRSDAQARRRPRRDRAAPHRTLQLLRSAPPQRSLAQRLAGRDLKRRSVRLPPTRDYIATQYHLTQILYRSTTRRRQIDHRITADPKRPTHAADRVSLLEIPAASLGHAKVQPVHVVMLTWRCRFHATGCQPSTIPTHDGPPELPPNPPPKLPPTNTGMNGQLQGHHGSLRINLMKP